MNQKLAFVFPGQGSQSVGMLQALSEDHSSVAATFEEASQVLGQDLWALVCEGPRETLDQTRNTQPAMLAAGVAVWRVWNERDGERPAFLAGHSLGEFTALVCAGALEYGDAVRVVAARGRFMQDAVPAGNGAMAAILGLADDEVRELCAGAAQGQVVEAVNFNSPGQVVIAGDAAAVGRALDAAKTAGAKRALPLPVSVPSHCALMLPAAKRLRAELEDVRIGACEIPVLHNVTAEPSASPDQVRELLTRQLYSPVRWVETVQRLAGGGVKILIEAGPGKVLTGLAKRIDKTIDALAVFDPAGLAAALETTRHA